MRIAQVSVPATITNLGPGFGSLGLALELRNTVLMYKTLAGLDVSIDGETAHELPTNGTNITVQAAYAVFNAVGTQRPQGLTVRCINHIPLACGLDSSTPALLAGMAAANLLIGAPLSNDDLVQLAIQLDAEPHTAAVALNGGLTVSGIDQGSFHTEQLETSPMPVVIARTVREIPKQTPPPAYTQPDGDLARALQRADYDLLRKSVVNLSGSAYTDSNFPGYNAAAKAAVTAGAALVTTGGTRPALIAFAQHNHAVIRAMMVDTLQAHTGKPANGWVVDLATEGITGKSQQ